MSGNSGLDMSKSKSERESPERSRWLEGNHNKGEGSVKDTTQFKENPQ